jgi:hypothetical protein
MNGGHKTLMKLAIITPRFKEPPEWVNQCITSVAEQGVECTQIVVNDGGDHGAVRAGHVETIELPAPHGDYGDAARAIGSASAVARGFDAIAYLDADNWYLPNHLKSLLALHEQTKAAVCSSTRMLHQPDGKVLGKCPEVDGERFVDTNCLMVFRPAFTMLPIWFLMPPEYHIMGDRIFWRAVLESKLLRAHSGKPTVAYRTVHRFHYDFFGVEPPADAKELRIFLPTEPQTGDSQ